MSRYIGDRSSREGMGRARRALAATGLLAALACGPAAMGAPHSAQAAGVAHASRAALAPRDSSATPSASDTASPTATGPASTDSTATAGASGTPAVTASPTASPTATAPVLPRVPRSVTTTVHRTNGYQIGAYYFSGWSHGPNDNLTPLLTNGPLSKYQPLIGWYDDSQAQVDKHIQQASSAGINFFAFDWYDIARSPYATDQSLNEALYFYLSSPQRHRMNFAITFIDQAPFLPKTSDWPHLVDQWIALFKQPDYVRVNGKPLFIIFSPEHMRGSSAARGNDAGIFGSSRAVKQALDLLRARAVKAHLPGVTIAVGATLVPHFNPGRIGQLLAEGYDVTTGYNYHAIGGEKYRVHTPYKTLVQENQQMWDRVAANIRLPYIPVITSGWDQRFSQREQSTAIIYAGRTPAQFACYAASARQWVDSNAKRTVKERLVLVFAWNEIGEGGAIIPNKADRYAYTDALSHAFTARQAPICK